MSTLWKEEIDILELQDKCEAIANKLQEIEGWLYTEFSDASKFKSFIIDDKSLYLFSLSIKAGFSEPTLPILNNFISITLSIPCEYTLHLNNL